MRSNARNEPGVAIIEARTALAHRADSHGGVRIQPVTRPGEGVSPLVIVLLAASLIVPMLAVYLAPAKQRWLKLEKAAVPIFLAVTAFGIALDLRDLFHAMLQPPVGLTGIQLLNSSISLWASNVLMFSVAYWWIDRGGAESRVSGLRQMPDWRFPREDADEGSVSPWQPTYVDYLFLAFCTATSFGPTEAMPMTARAKLLMMAESLISLVTVLAIASRAIGLLGS